VTGLPAYTGATPTPTTTEFVAPYGAPTYTPQHPGASSQVDNNKRPGTTTSVSSPTDGLESGSRVAAEEDKRRRNTAASARFRVKKKQREQALERTAKEMTDRAEKLEARITELEQENKFLRSLVVEKAGSSTKEEEGVSDVLRKVAADARKADSAKKGVGTEA
jgi:acyl-CoA reductase-like NAD-dependent aldehyde dehydrogenase